MLCEAAGNTITGTRWNWIAPVYLPEPIRAILVPMQDDERIDRLARAIEQALSCRDRKRMPAGTDLMCGRASRWWWCAGLRRVPVHHRSTAGRGNREEGPVHFRDGQQTWTKNRNLSHCGPPGGGGMFSRMLMLLL